MMTHAAPRGGQPSRVPAARAHAAALEALLGFKPPEPPLPPGVAVVGSRSDRPGSDAASRAAKAGAKAEARAAIEAKQAAQPRGGGGGGGGGNYHGMTPKNAPSMNFGGHDKAGKFIFYRGMARYPSGNVVLVRRQTLGSNPARNVKFLGNLRGGREAWTAPLEAARGRAAAARGSCYWSRTSTTISTSASRANSTRTTASTSSAASRPPEKKMISKWETYMPVALHRTFERLARQPMTVGADDLDAFEFTSLFDKLRTKDVEEVVKRSSEHCWSSRVGGSPTLLSRWRARARAG